MSTFAGVFVFVESWKNKYFKKYFILYSPHTKAKAISCRNLAKEASIKSYWAS